MALIYDLARFVKSGMKAMQCAQRDWSPYLVHFTQAVSLQAIRGLFDDLYTEPERIKQCLDYSDRESFRIAAEIIASGVLKASSIHGKESNSCVCFSECTLSGVIGHSERYGRFGFAFSKSDVYQEGGRPCVYADDDICREAKKNKDAGDVAARLWGLMNVYRPVGHIQDYSHEREWRIFRDFSLRGHLLAVIVPDQYVTDIRSLLINNNLEVPILPIDMLYDWGV